jgi:hypothetical protein
VLTLTLTAAPADPAHPAALLQCILTCKPEYAYGRAGAGGVIPPNASECAAGVPNALKRPPHTLYAQAALDLTHAAQTLPPLPACLAALAFEVELLDFM